jgi:hypothetical protein
MTKKFIIKFYWILSNQLGLDPFRFFQSLLGIPNYIKDLWKFHQKYSGKLNLMPCLHDRFEEGGTTKSEYFLQDLLVARWIYEAQPVKHIDVGSRIDGFVAHVASFREIEVCDVRPVSTKISGIIFRQIDLMQEKNIDELVAESYDSLSCLHALEHFGLGRYGDSIDVYGYEKGIANMANLIKADGKLYLSTPIGQEKVEFNAHWIFDPRTIIKTAEINDLRLDKLIIIQRDGEIVDMQINEQEISRISKEQYVLGIFVFIKKEAITSFR